MSTTSTPPPPAGRPKPLSSTASTTVDPPKVTSPYRSRHQITRSISELYSPTRLNAPLTSPPILATAPTSARESSTSVNVVETPSGSLGREAGKGRRDALERMHAVQMAALAQSGSIGQAQAGAGKKREEKSGLVMAVAPVKGIVERPVVESGRAYRALGEQEGKMEKGDWVKEEQARLCRVKGVSTLQELLDDLTATAEKAATVTDTNYHSMIETFASLQSMVREMRALVDESEATTSTFIQQTVSLENKITSQLSIYNSLNSRRDRIAAMEKRLEEGRKKMEGLSERVAKVNRTVGGWEAADAEWQERTKKRLRNVWIVTMVLAVVVAVVWVFQGVEAEMEQVGEVMGDVVEGVTTGIAEMGVPGVEVSDEPDIGNGSLLDDVVVDFAESKTEAIQAARAVINGEQKVEAVPHDSQSTSESDSSSEWTESLRIFDEL